MKIVNTLPHGYPSNSAKPLPTNSNKIAFKGIETEIAKNTEQVSKNIFKTIGNALSPATNFINNTIGVTLKKLGNTEPVQKLAERLSKSLKFSRTHLMVADSIIISSFYMINTANNKNIDKKQKPQMIINDALVLTASTVCSYLLDGKINKVVDKFVDVFRKTNKHLDPKTLNSYQDGIKNFKSILILGIIYRYISPVLFTPVANKLSDMLQNKKNTKNITNKQEQQQTQGLSFAPVPLAFKAFSK